MDNIANLLRQVESEYEAQSRQNSKMIERNLEYLKIMATVKNDLEKTLKKPETLKETVYNCINLLRANTPYYSATEAVNKIDPPLSDEQKTL
jgi:hypothetical protein